MKLKFYNSSSQKLIVEFCRVQQMEVLWWVALCSKQGPLIHAIAAQAPSSMGPGSESVKPMDIGPVYHQSAFKEVCLITEGVWYARVWLPLANYPTITYHYSYHACYHGCQCWPDYLPIILCNNNCGNSVISSWYDQILGVLSSDNWIKDFDSNCTHAAICRPLQRPEHGFISIRGHGVGSVAFYHCSSTYNLIGQRTRKCWSNGMWSGTSPSCRGKAIVKLITYYKVAEHYQCPGWLHSVNSKASIIFLLFQLPLGVLPPVLHPMEVLKLAACTEAAWLCSPVPVAQDSPCRVTGRSGVSAVVAGPVLPRDAYVHTSGDRYVSYSINNTLLASQPHPLSHTPNLLSNSNIYSLAN